MSSPCIRQACNAVAALAPLLPTSRLDCWHSTPIRWCWRGIPTVPVRRLCGATPSSWKRPGSRCRVLTITGAKDPDEFIKKYGAERFELLVEGSKSALDFQIQQLRSRNDITSAEGRIAFLQEFVRLMAATPSPIQRDVYISKVCRELEVDKQAVVLQLEAALKRKRSGEQKKEARDLKVFTDRDPAGRMDFERQRSPKSALAGERLIAYLMKNPDQVSRVATSVREEQFVSPMDRRLYQLVKERLLAACTDCP